MTIVIVNVGALLDEVTHLQSALDAARTSLRVLTYDPDAEAVRAQTLALRRTLDELEDHAGQAQDLLGGLEEEAGLVDPETGARFDEQRTPPKTLKERTPPKTLKKGIEYVVVDVTPEGEEFITKKTVTLVDDLMSTLVDMKLLSKKLSRSRVLVEDNGETWTISIRDVPGERSGYLPVLKLVTTERS